MFKLNYPSAHKVFIKLLLLAPLFLLVQNVFAQSTVKEIFKGFNQFSEAYKISNNESDNGNGIKNISLNAIRQQGNREFPYPVKGHTLIANPPIFTWPMADYEYPKTFPETPSKKKLEEYLRYDFQLGQDKKFFKTIINANGLRMPFYNNHKALAPGTWYWRYRVAGKQWSQTFEIDILPNIPKFESPKENVALKLIPSQHPRIFKPLKINSPTADQSNLIAQYKSKANAALGKNIVTYKVKGEEIPATASKQERDQILKFRLRYEIEGMCSDIENLLMAYDITHNEKYLDKALTFTRYIASLNGVEMYEMADFSASKSMSTLAMTYDIAYDKINLADKKQYENFIIPVAKLIMGEALKENIGSADGIVGEHFFQHIFHNVFVTSMVMKDHTPEAKIWFDMLYNIWLSRSPAGGFASDGVWPNGNMGYLHVSMESMVSNFILFRDLFNVNTFSHPWYLNCANALAYTIPIKSAGDGFADGSDEWEQLNKLRTGFAYILGQELNNPFAINYAYKISNQSLDSIYQFNGSVFSDYRLQHQPKKIMQLDWKTIPQSAVFPESGIAVMNTDVLDAKKNLFLSFYSSPFGIGSHALAEQNSFNIIYKGKPLFYPTGYRITTQDKHYLLAQKHSRARNTITVDGMTQGYSQKDYGWLPRYLDGENITYVMGDASNAYKKMDSTIINWITVLKNANSYDTKNGFIINDEDDPKVSKFRRHVALLRPNIVVVYDELEAQKPVNWTFQLNGLQRANMTLNPNDKSLIANTDNGDALVNVFSSLPTAKKLVDSSFVKPFDWLNPQRGRPAKKFDKQQFHYKVENVEKSKQMRYFAVIQIDESNGLSFTNIQPDNKGNIAIGDYMINAQLNLDQPARLEIENKKTGEYLLYGPSNGASKAKGRKFSLSTILVNSSNGFQESIDRYPMMVTDKK
ncbi:DUF4962 domain-containing protein [Flavobacterium sp. ST-87]|uniref:DUF4962 domain-containing protein n=1 Tax=Flavobacterium plantiphilum TaxID=3163297 RepID=A0ABW8XNT7_9FLAO